MKRAPEPPASGVQDSLYGNPEDPTGTDPFETGRAFDDDERQPKGAAGREGGAAGELARPFRGPAEPGRDEPTESNE